MTIKFVEIDCGPGGIVWESHSDEFGEYLRTYDSEARMLDDAAFCYHLGMKVRFYTQAEYQLQSQMEIMVENGIFGPDIDNGISAAV